MIAPPPVDFDHPNPARIYEYLLGGAPGFRADREEADRLGAGFPVYPAVHKIAREAADPASPVAYVDHDPVVVSHARAGAWGEYWGEGIAVIEADLTDPPSVLGDPALRAVIDMAGPVCVILGLVLSLMPARQARQVAGYADLIAPGSCIVISCGRCDDEVLWKQLSEAYTAAEIFNHSPADVEGFLAGLEIVPPGIVAAPNLAGRLARRTRSATGAGVRARRGRAQAALRAIADTGRSRGGVRFVPSVHH